MAIVTLLIVTFATACTPRTPSPHSSVSKIRREARLPVDADDTCALVTGGDASAGAEANTVASWFQTGKISLDGVVTPADSLNNPFGGLAIPCGFYEWSERMFLWLTSPAPGTCGGRIFDSPMFYDVSPPDATGNRTFLSHVPCVTLTPAPVRHVFLRAAQAGPHCLPVIVDRSGQLLEIKSPDAKVKPLVRDQSGQLVEIAHVRLEGDGRRVLLDNSGKVIDARHVEKVAPTDLEGGRQALFVQEFIVHGIVIFVDPSLSVVDVESGQADEGVLEAQTGSLVYYLTVVNDVYAYFLTGVKNGAIKTTTPNQLPTTPADLAAIQQFAATYGTSLTDLNAMAIEVKSSWVLASGLPNPSSYITMTATIPVYNQIGSDTLKPSTQQQTVQLAMVGIHVVGSILGNPEMVWATFEHVGNTPVATYTYTTGNGVTLKTVPEDVTGPWLFSASASGPFNMVHMKRDPLIGDINAVAPFTIGPSDTRRSEPWGMDGGSAASNTQVISMNSNVLGALDVADVRNNYVMTGATWTGLGSSPDNPAHWKGTTVLSNTTMETYEQGSTNCFTCHVSPQSVLSSVPNQGLSHIWGGLSPLPCGGPGQQCCPGQSCAGGLSCVNSMCQCGGLGEPCCNGTSCNSALLTCSADRNSQCISACGHMGESCCNSPPSQEPPSYSATGSLPGWCYNGEGVGCSSGNVCGCGGPGLPCCRSGNRCSGNLTCLGTVCTTSNGGGGGTAGGGSPCVACPTRPCCPPSTCVPGPLGPSCQTGLQMCPQDTYPCMGQCVTVRQCPACNAGCL